MEMLVPDCVGSYGRKAVSRPWWKIRDMMGVLGPKGNFFSRIVCTLDQYLENCSIKTVLLT